MPAKKTAKITGQTALYEKINASFSENALKMMRKRYLITHDNGKQETPAEMFRRVANALAAVEKNYGHDQRFIAKTADDFFNIMASKEYTPAGRTMTNAGSPTPLIANCIVLPVLDSMESIFQTLKDAAMLQQAGSGLGFDFSHLRPAMSPTKKSRGVSSGPVLFLKVYNEAFGVIKQQSRNGANMAMMQVDHPDILDFIRAKEIEGEIRNFNISVKVTDEFMKKLMDKPNDQWYCEWNGKKMKPRRVIRAKNGSVVGVEELEITVKQIFDELVNYAWLNGEPGIVFIDEVNRTNPLPGLGSIDCSNPCVVGDTLIPTEKGFLKISEIAQQFGAGGLFIATEQRVAQMTTEKHFAAAKQYGGGTTALLEKTQVLLAERFSANQITRAWQTGIKPVYKLETESGYEVLATADHKIMTTEGKVELQNLNQDHRIVLQSREGLFSQDYRLPFTPINDYKGRNGHSYQYNFPDSWSLELGQILGWLIGDGWLRDKKGEARAGFVFAEEDTGVLDYLKPILNRFYGRDINEIKRSNGVFHLSFGKPFVDFFKSLGVAAVSQSEAKEIPQTFWGAPREAIIGFLQGLFGADGTIQNDEAKGTRYVRLTAKSLKLLKQVQILLINLGIKSNIYDRSRPERIAFKYTTRKGELHQYISDGVLYELQISRDSLPLFLDKVGFLGKKFEDKIAQLKNHGYYRESFTEKIKSVVYIGEKEVFDLTEPFSATFIANGIVVSNCGEQFLHHYDNCNLGSINLALFVKDGKIDWSRLRFVTKTAVRLMDNVIDLFDFPVKQVTDLARKNRRIGLGIMGFADMIYQLGIAYNSEEGQKTAEKVMKAINHTAHETSRELAKEKGAFPNMPLSIYAKKKIKLRNAALTTVAPTGSISMMFDCSSGIEPNFALAYVKQDKDGHQYHYFNRYFEEALKYYKFSKEKIQEIKEEIIKTGSIQRLTDLPEDLRKTFVVSMDIGAPDHMKMQAAFQRNVDNSISKTINFPNSATKDDVANGYILAWKLKCKSATVYRDGSRNVQILNLGTGENLTAPSEIGSGAPKKLESAPLDLAIDKNRLTPRERPEAMVGKTYKIKTGYGNMYVTVNDDAAGAPFEVFATIGKSGGFFQEQSEAICRMISLSMRSGIKVEAIIEQLKGIRGPMPVMTEKGTILSLPDAIGQILEDHVKNKSSLTVDAQAQKELVTVSSEVKEEIHATAASSKQIADLGLMPGCPDCGAALTMGEGCLSCRQCGFSRCL